MSVQFFPTYEQVLRSKFGGLVFDVREYGADPLGVEDSTGAIQEAVRHATNAGRAIVWLPGRFLISDTIAINSSYIWLRGFGLSLDQSDSGVTGVGASSLFPSTSFPANVPLVRFGSLSNASFLQGNGVSGLIVTGNSAPPGQTVVSQGGDGIDFLNCQAFHVDSACAEFTNGYGVYAQSNIAGGTSAAQITRSFLYSTGKAGAYYDNGMVINWIRDNYFVDCGDYGICANGDQTFIRGNHVEGTKTTGSGAYASGTAIFADAAFCEIEGNDITTSALHGIYAIGWARVVNNTIIDPNGSGGGGCGVYTETQNPAGLIADNDIEDTRGTPLMKYGVQVQSASGASVCRVRDNTIIGAVTAPVFFYGPPMVRASGNVGYNPVGPTTVAVPLSGSPTVALPYDATFYITQTTAASSVSVQGQALAIPVGGPTAIRVPAGQTLTPTYTTAPTWVVMGE